MTSPNDPQEPGTSPRESTPSQPSIEAGVYAAPTADVETPVEEPADGLVPAPRLHRLAAQLVNGLIGMVAAVPFVAALMISFSPDREVWNAWTAAGLSITVVANLAILGVNLVWLAREGQSIGKRAVGIRIVRQTGELASLGRLVFLRYLAINAIAILLNAVLLVAGSILQLVNYLLIFREDRRCLHDHIADTVVVEA